MKISKEQLKYIFNKKIEINCILYFIMLDLELIITKDVLIIIINIKEYKNSFISIYYNISVNVNIISVLQIFFIIIKDSNYCILKKVYKNIIYFI